MAYWLPDEDPTKRYLIDDVLPRGPIGPGVGGPGVGSRPSIQPIDKVKKKSFQDLINSDPIYAQLRDSLAAQGIVDAASRRSAIQRALINFGLVPDFAKAGLSGDALGFLGQDVDPATRSQAENMTGQGLSFLARLNKANAGAVTDLKNELAAKGILESGATGYGLNEQAGRYKESLFDAEQQLFDTLMGYIGTYTEGERARQQALIDGLAEAAGRIPEEEPPDLTGTPGRPGTKSKSKPSEPQPMGPATPWSPGKPRDLVPSEGGAKGGAEVKNPRKKKPKPKPNTGKGGQRIGGV